MRLCSDAFLHGSTLRRVQYHWDSDAGHGPDGALDVGRRVLAAIAALDIPHSASAFGRVTASIGIAQVVAMPSNASQELLERADRALYAAKQAGRNRVKAMHTYFPEHQVAQ